MGLVEVLFLSRHGSVSRLASWFLRKEKKGHKQWVRRGVARVSPRQYFREWCACGGGGICGKRKFQNMAKWPLGTIRLLASFIIMTGREYSGRNERVYFRITTSRRCLSRSVDGVVLYKLVVLTVSSSWQYPQSAPSGAVSARRILNSWTMGGRLTSEALWSLCPTECVSEGR